MVAQVVRYSLKLVARTRIALGANHHRLLLFRNAPDSVRPRAPEICRRAAHNGTREIVLQSGFTTSAGVSTSLRQ